MDDDLKQSLAAYRAAKTPSRAQEEAARAALGARIAAGDPGLDVPAEVLTGAGAKASVGGMVKWLGGILIVGAGAAAIGFGLPSAELRQPGAAPRVAVPQATEGTGPAADAPHALPDSQQSPHTEPAPASAAVAAPVLRVPSRAHAPAAGGAPAKEASTLREEMALLSRGQEALQASDPATALAQFDEHRRRFPAGSLSAERDVKRMVALCQLGRKGEARALATRFAARHAGSPLATRALTICRGSDE